MILRFYNSTFHLLVNHVQFLAQVQLNTQKFHELCLFRDGFLWPFFAASKRIEGIEPKNGTSTSVSYDSCIFHRAKKELRSGISVLTFPRLRGRESARSVHVTMPGATYLASRAPDSAPTATLSCTWILHKGATISILSSLDRNRGYPSSRHLSIRLITSVAAMI